MRKCDAEMGLGEDKIAATEPNPSGRSLAFFLLLGAAFLYLQLFALPCTPIFLFNDHLIFLHDARQMLEGRVLYRDIFQFTFPGTPAFYFALFKAFGARVWLPNAVLVGLGTILAWLTILISKRILAGPSAFLPAFLLFSLEFRAWQVANHHWFSTIAAMAAVLVVLEERSPARVAAAGAFCGVTAWFTQTKGALLILGLAVFVLWKRRRNAQPWAEAARYWAFLFAGFLSALGLGVGYFVWKAGPEQFLWSTFVFPMKYYAADAANNSIETYWTSLRGLRGWELVPLLIVYASVPWVYLWFLLAYRRRDTSISKPWDRLMLLNLAGVSMFISVAAAPGWLRLCPVSVPALILLVWLLKVSASRISRALYVSLWIAGSICAAAVITKTIRHERLWHASLDLPVGRAVFLDPEPYEECRWLMTKTRPSDYFFGGRDPYLYFPLGLRTPSEVSSITPNDYTRPDQVRHLIEGLESHRVRYLMWQSSLDGRPGDAPAGDHLQPLREYLRRHYRMIKMFSGFFGDQVWERKD